MSRYITACLASCAASPACPDPIRSIQFECPSRNPLSLSFNTHTASRKYNCSSFVPRNNYFPPHFCASPIGLAPPRQACPQAFPGRSGGRAWEEVFVLFVFSAKRMPYLPPYILPARGKMPPNPASGGQNIRFRFVFFPKTNTSRDGNQLPSPNLFSIWGGVRGRAFPPKVSVSIPKY